jgi:hypothetical protein
MSQDKCPACGAVPPAEFLQQVAAKLPKGSHRRSAVLTPCECGKASVLVTAEGILGWLTGAIGR